MRTSRKLKSDRFPRLAFLTAVALTIALLGALSWHSVRAYRTVKEFQRRDFAIERVSGQITYLDEVLTMSARMAAATGDLKWEARYNRYVTLLDEALELAQALAPGAEEFAGHGQTEAANKELVALERKAFDLVRNNDKARAVALLTSEEYEKYKVIYSEGVDRYLGGMQRRVSHTLTWERTRARWAMIATLAITFFLIFVWSRVGAAIRSHTVERKRTEEALRESEERYRTLFEQAANSIVLIDVDSGSLVAFNDKTYEGLGYAREEFQNLRLADLEAMESPEEIVAHLAKVTEEGADSFETKQKTKQGEVRSIQVSARAVSIGGKNLVQAIWYDITERKRAEQTLRFLVQELDHRVRNILATVGSVAEQTLLSSASLTEFGEAFQGRIRALARVHEASTENKGEPLRLRELIEMMVAPFSCDGKRVSMQGDVVVLSPSSVRPMGMALHELATNATKYGAFSTTGGHVAVSWQVESTSAGTQLRITWAESGGPAVARPSRCGLGTLLVEKGVTHELGGEANLKFPEDGVQCEIVIPLPDHEGAA